METMISSANLLIRCLCDDKDGWQYAGGKQMRGDPWGADRVLAFSREDRVVCYVGFREDKPVYVLQKVE